MTEDFQIQTLLLPPGDELTAYKDDIWKILEKTDADFVPPLSSRKPITLGAMQLAERQWSLPIEHLEFALKLHVILAFHDYEVVGFLSFEPNFKHDTINDLDSTVLIDTVAVPPRWRRRGVARALYKTLFDSELFQAHEHAVLHTWSTNYPHGDLIEAIGFKELDRIVDERAPGIDTVIYHRLTEPNPFDQI